jgi:hypothetical protein
MTGRPRVETVSMSANEMDKQVAKLQAKAYRLCSQCRHRLAPQRKAISAMLNSVNRDGKNEK